MATKLSIYNGALRALGERHTTLTEAREPRRLLDDVWDGGGLDRCLAAGQWNWAARTVQLSASLSQPSFGYTNAFELPSDAHRVLAVASDGRMERPLTRYEFSNSVFYADLEAIYIRYVSNDPSYGGDLSIFPPHYESFVEAHFAAEIAPKLTAAADKVDRMIKRRRDALNDAQAIDAQFGPSQLPPTGSWARARHGSGASRGSREN